MSNIFYSEEIKAFIDSKTDSSSVFARLPENIKRKLLQGKEPLTFSDGVVMRSGTGGRGLWLIKEGFVRVGRFSKDGEYCPLVVSSSGNSFGDLTCLSPDYPPIDGIAAGPVQAYWISCEEFNNIIAESPEIHLQIMNILATVLLMTYDHILSTKLQDSMERLRQSLRLFCSHKKSPVPLPISQHELAAMVGVSRVTISKDLKILENEGILERKYGKMQIIKPKSL